MTTPETVLRAPALPASTSPAALTTAWFVEGCHHELGIAPAGLPLAVDAGRDAFEALAASHPALRVGIESPDGAVAVAGLPVRVQTTDGTPPLPAALIDTEDAASLQLVASVDLHETLSRDDLNTISLQAIAPFDVDAVIFDLDGTLVNSIDAYFEVARVAAASRGHVITRDFVTALPGIDAMLGALHERSLRLGVVTAGSGTTATPLKASGVHDLIACTVTRADVAEPKPDPEGLTIALDRLGVPAERALYIGDSRVDVLTARSAGVAALGVLTGAGTAESLAAVRPVQVLPTLNTLDRLIVE